MSVGQLAAGNLEWLVDVFGTASGLPETTNIFETASKFPETTERFYDTATARFTQVDQMGAGVTEQSGVVGLNLYAYVGNDPIEMVDPWGQARVPKNIKRGKIPRENGHESNKCPSKRGKHTAADGKNPLNNKNRQRDDWNQRFSIPEIDWGKVGVGVGVIGIGLGIIFAPEITIPAMACAVAL